MKTLEATTKEAIDEAVNQFKQDHRVRATQTNVCSHNGNLLYTYTVWYDEDE